MKFSISYLPARKRWRLEYRNGKRFRVNFKTKALAQAEAERLQEDLERAGAVWVAMSHPERNELMSVVTEMREEGLTPRQAWDEFKRLRVAGGAQTGTVTAEKALTELHNAKLAAGRAKLYLANLKQIIGDFIVGREYLPVSRFTLADVETFLNQYNIEYRSTLRSRLATWFRFAVKRGYRADNPCERLETIRLRRGAPRVFTLPEVTKALGWLQVHPRALAWFYLSTFAGLRPEEAQKTTWKMINFQDGWIRCEEQTTKTGERRVVYPRPGVMDALKYAKAAGSVLPLSRLQMRRERTKLRKALGLEAWPKDVTRHTAASMWLAAAGEASKVAGQLGHSERILHSRYKALVLRTDAQKFWWLVDSCAELPS